MTTYPRRQARRLTVALLADAGSFAAFALLVGFAGVHQERNPLVAGIFAVAGWQGLVLVKGAAALLVERRSAGIAGTTRAYAVASSLAVAATVCGASLNIAALLSSKGVSL